jgi:hypothetical protein
MSRTEDMIFTLQQQVTQLETRLRLTDELVSIVGQMKEKWSGHPQTLPNWAIEMIRLYDRITGEEPPSKGG